MFFPCKQVMVEYKTIMKMWGEIMLKYTQKIILICFFF
jgi:hypothetical protein